MSTLASSLSRPIVPLPAMPSSPTTPLPPPHPARWVNLPTLATDDGLRISAPLVPPPRDVSPSCSIRTASFLGSNNKHPDVCITLHSPVTATPVSGGWTAACTQAAVSHSESVSQSVSQSVSSPMSSQTTQQQPDADSQSVSQSVAKRRCHIVTGGLTANPCRPNYTAATRC